MQCYQLIHQPLTDVKYHSSKATSLCLAWLVPVKAKNQAALSDTQDSKTPEMNRALSHSASKPSAQNSPQ